MRKMITKSPVAIAAAPGSGKPFGVLFANPMTKLYQIIKSIFSGEDGDGRLFRAILAGLAVVLTLVTIFLLLLVNRH